MTTAIEIIEQEPWVAKLTPAEFALTKEKIDKINARAVKRGFTGTLELVYERVVDASKNRIGLEVEKVYYRTSITGTAPCYNGWRFIARIDVLPNSDAFTLATAPGVEFVDRSLVKLNTCEHCDTKHRRKNIYLVENVESGDVKNVGSTCIKDFLGHDASFCFIDTESIASEFGSGGFDNREETFTVGTILAAAHLAIKGFGWVKSGDAGSTRDNLMNIIEPPKPSKHETFSGITYREKCEALSEDVPEALSRVRALLDWIATLDDSSTFNENLKAAVSGDEVTRKQIGILAYVPEGYARSIAKAVEQEVRDAENAEIAKVSEFIGEIGERIEVEGTIKSIKYLSGDYGVTTFYTIMTNIGLVKWFASNSALGEDVGVPVRIKGTVKKHDEYNGIKGTVLTRCKEITI